MPLGVVAEVVFEKWHRIPAGRELTDEEQHYAVAVVMEWIKRQLDE